MRGTKLWQDPRSPLISGRSRAQRPLGLYWLAGTTVAFAASGGVLALFVMDHIAAAPLEYATPAAILLAGSAIGAGLVVWIARQMGSRAPWLAGTIGGVVSALAVFGAYLVFLG